MDFSVKFSECYVAAAPVAAVGKVDVADFGSLAAVSSCLNRCSQSGVALSLAWMGPRLIMLPLLCSRLLLMDMSSYNRQSYYKN